MKIKTIFLTAFLLSLLLSIKNAAGEDPSAAWYPFVISEKMHQGSTANAGALTLDAPAGKHGFLGVSGNKFLFRDGSPMRFWGANLCFSANFPSKQQAELMADRLAFFGFNAVRLTHLDHFDEPEGIFEARDPSPHPSGTGFSKKLSEDQLGKLDYLIYKLKQKGIYIDVNLLVTRHFKEEEGVVEASALGAGARAVSLFDPRLIELQKEYARALFTHTNSYTKLKYFDDPAIALVEISNENSLIQQWRYNKLNGPIFGLKKDSIPDHYVSELDELWNAWLKKKYGSVAGVKKVWSTQPGKDGEIADDLLRDVSRWSTEQHEGAVLEKSDKDGEVALRIVKTASLPWHAQYYYGGLPVEKGAQYLLKFTARSDKPLQISVALQNNKPTWEILGLSESFLLKPEPQTYQVPFRSVMGSDDARLSFILGHEPGTVFLKEVALVKSGAPMLDAKEGHDKFDFTRPLYKFITFCSPGLRKDIEDFYFGLEETYFDEMRNFLVEDLHVKVPITGMGGYRNKADIQAQRTCDFIDKHVYWAHPQFPGQAWDRSNFKMDDGPLLMDKRLGLVGEIIESSVSNKPFTVTEWGHCFPNSYAYEAPVFIASASVKHGWNGLFQFAFRHYAPVLEELSSINNYFDAMTNPQQLILDAVASLVMSGKPGDFETHIDAGVFTIRSSYLEGAAGKIGGRSIATEHLIIESSEDGAVFVCATDRLPIEISKRLLIATVGRVKNSGSYWDRSGKFHWGGAPVLMQKMNVKIQIRRQDKAQVYELDKAGNRERNIAAELVGDHLVFSTSESHSPWFELTEN